MLLVLWTWTLRASVLEIYSPRAGCLPTYAGLDDSRGSMLSQVILGTAGRWKDDRHRVLAEDCPSCCHVGNSLLGAAHIKLWRLLRSTTRHGGLNCHPDKRALQPTQGQASTSRVGAEQEKRHQQHILQDTAQSRISLSSFVVQNPSILTPPSH